MYVDLPIEAVQWLLDDAPSDIAPLEDTIALLITELRRRNPNLVERAERESVR